MEKIDQILESLYDMVIEPMEAKEQLLDLFAVSGSVCEHDFKPCDHPAIFEFDKCTKCGKIR